MMEHEERCMHLTTAAKAVRGTNPLHDTIESISEGIDAADCCREAGLFDIATELLELAKTFPIASEPTLKERIELQLQMIADADRTCIVPIYSEAPPLLIRGWNFGKAMMRWAGSGFKMRTNEEIDERLAICQTCPILVNATCTHANCGCNINEKNQVLNKLAIATESCPDGKWS